MLIGFVGSHGTGKTTTARVTAALMDGKPLLSASREVNLAGLPINKDATRLTQLMITVARSNQAILYGKHNTLYVADRTPFDSLAYTKYQMAHIWEPNEDLDKIYWKYSFEMALNTIPYYTKFFYFPPLEELEDDGVRLADRAYQKEIDDRLRSILYAAEVPIITVPEGSVLERAHFIQAACEIMV